MKKKDQYLYAIVSLLFGIFGIVAWLFPIIGFPTSLVGLSLGLAARQSSKRNMAKIGIILSAIGLVLTIANAAFGAYMGYKGQLFLNP